jgi:diguanylate cyclase (GGDEF)-like protein
MLSISRPAIKNIDFFKVFQMTYYEGDLGPLFTIGVFSSVVVYIYLMFLLFLYYKKHRNSATIAIIVSQFLYFAVTMNDSCIAAGVYSFIYLSEYGFFVVILAMTYVLLDEFMGLYKAVEESNRTLEMKVAERTEEISKLNKELKCLAELDALTGIYNRRFFNDYLEIELKRARNRQLHRSTEIKHINDMNFAVAIIDVDHFKQVNDTYGHLAGDKLLVELVNIINQTIFTKDVFCRYGGEEFVILITRITREGTVTAAEKVRKSVQNHHFSIGTDNSTIPITVSIGVATYDELPDVTGTAILKLADDRLLIAKERGRNIVISR